MGSTFLNRVVANATIAAVFFCSGLFANVVAQSASPAKYDIVVEENVMITMSDGTKLAADIYRPKADGKFPTLIERTPYNKKNSSEIQAEAHVYFAERGYVFIVQDTRGRFASEGKFYPNLDDAWLKRRDGFESVEWIAKQPWSDGKVGVIGGSQTGQTAYYIGPTQPKAMTSMFVRESASDLHAHWYYRGGAFEHGFVTPWTALTFGPDVVSRNLKGPQREAAEAALKHYSDNRKTIDQHLPLVEFPVFKDIPGMEFYYDWVGNQADGPYWWQQNVGLRHNMFTVPVYHLGGWYDIFLDGTIKNYTGIRDKGATAEARRGQKLVIGPWVHGPANVGVTKVASMTYANADQVKYNDIRLKWFDHHLRGMDTGVMREPPVLIYVMGDNKWRNENEWPLARTKYTKYYFTNNTSGSISSINDGGLSSVAPSGAAVSDSFLYDPGKPIATLGGNTLFVAQGPNDHREADLKSLTYTSDILSTDLEVTGPVKAVLHAMSSAVDTDWTVRLSEVYPDGRSINIVDGILRARYRNSTSKAELIEPGKIYVYEIDLWATSNVFKAGNRLRVSVHSSNYPRWSRNLNTAETPEVGVRFETAINTIFKDELRPSHIILPVVPR
jgi:uncharacterized protein